MHTQSTSDSSDIFLNTAVSSDAIRTNATTNQEEIRLFHARLSGYEPTRLFSLSRLAEDLRLSACLIRDESSRLGLPAFKILGASWGVYRALCSHLKITPNPAVSTIELLRAAIDDQRKAGNTTILYAATDGNHGRAVARMAKLLILSDDALENVAQRKHLAEDEIGAKVYVPKEMYESTRELIRSEGVHVVEINGDYDTAVKACWDESRACQNGSAIMVQDNAFEYHEDGQVNMYRDVPSWIVEGYGTLLWECDERSLV